MKRYSTNEIFFATTKTITVIVLLIIIYWSWSVAAVFYSYFSYDKKPVVIKNTVLAGYLANTEAERVKGLSGKSFLPSNTTMLFVFDKPDTYGIWMKDMSFPIDILWLDKNKNVIHSLSNVEPSTYPHVFYPSEPAMYVLELRAGYLKESGIKNGEAVYFEE